MKCEDLMIGDLVYHHNEVVRITGIGQNLVTYIYYHYVDCEVSEIEPIPLSEEILEKNGFEGSPTRDLFIEMNLWETCALEVLPSEGSWIVRMCNAKANKYIYKYNKINLYIKYVHELQHALRLFGIKKEIKYEM